MPKKTKGKQKDYPKSHVADGPPIITLGSPALSAQMKSPPKINTAVVHSAAASPSAGHAEVASGSTAGDNWGSWGQQHPADNHEDEEDGGAAWGNDTWAQGATGSHAHTSPAAHTSPVPAARWGQEDEPAWSMPTGGGLVSAVSKAFGFGANPDAANAPPGLKSTLKASTPGAPTQQQPASKRVAFNAGYPSLSGGAPAPPPPPAPPQPTAVPTSASQQMNSHMRGRSHSQPQPGHTTAAWGAAQQSPAAGGWPQPTGYPSPAAQVQGHGRPRAATIVAPPASQSNATATAQAWMQWGRKDASAPQLTTATTIAANVPTAHAQQPHAALNPAADAALARARLLQEREQLTRQLQAAQLQQILGGPAKAAPSPGMHHRQMSAPADIERSPTWQAQPKQSWQEWAKGKQELAPQRGVGGAYGKPQAPKMQPSESWGSSEWTDVGRGGHGGGGYGGGAYGGGGYGGGGGGGGGSGAGGGWGEASDHGDDDGGWETSAATGGGLAGGGWGAAAPATGDWGTTAPADGGWGTQHPSASFGGQGAIDERGRKGDRGKERSRSKRHDEWGQSHDDGWGKAKEEAAWGAAQDRGPSGGGDVWGSSKGALGMGRSPKQHNTWGPSTIHEEDEEEEYDDEDEETYDEDEDEEDEDDHDGHWPQSQSHHQLRHATHAKPEPDKHNAGNRLSYEYRAPGTLPAGQHSLTTGLAMAQLGAYSPMTHSTGRTPVTPQAQRPPLLPNPDSSKTMNFATGRMNALFDTTPPLKFHWSEREGLRPADRALFASDQRLARERIHWGFNETKDQRVSSLMAWIDNMTNELALRGLSKFLETRSRGALFVNADYRDTSTGRTQPAFDWLTLPQVQNTLDKNLQKYVVCYRPSTTVLVFVFLLSKTGNSLAIWRKKISVPADLAEMNRDLVQQTLEIQEQGRVVYIDEQNEPEPPPVPPKKSLWGKFVGLFRSKKKLKKKKQPTAQPA